jgi:selenocysteine-specific elongation factor
MIIGTAGHIDHGKTTLVRALSGVDTDRLKEEKARGISIELGYAYVPLKNGNGTLGFIDVPGHEKLVHTMAAGACGIDFALLVIAADDGVMPQTREHLAILELLGVKQGAVAVTKTDRVDAERVREVHAQITGLLSNTSLSDAPLFDTNAAQENDAGVAALDEHLHDIAAQWTQRRDDGLFRLAVDRVFTLAGQGTIATGTVFAGSVNVNDSVTLAPRTTHDAMRVRSIHAQNRASQTGKAGERCALNLAGIDKQALARGDWLVDARLARASERIDVELKLLDDAAITLTHWMPLHVHLGTTHRVANVALLETDTLNAGQTARVQLVFDEPICALPGDRFIVRNAQADRTIGGGRVLDPFAPARKRRTPQRRAWLDALTSLIDTGNTQALVEQAPYGLPGSLITHLCGHAIKPEGMHEVSMHDDTLFIAPRHWDALTTRLIDALANFHERMPDEQGPDIARLRRMAAPLAPDALWRALVESAVKQGEIAKSGPWLHLPAHAVTLNAAEEKLAQEVLASIEEGKFDPPWMRELAITHNVSEEDMRRLLRKLARRGDLFQVVRDLFYSRASIDALAKLVERAADTQGGGVGAAAFRDASALGRKRAIQVLEFFDRVGYTRFHRDLHLIRADSRWHESV